LSAEIIATESQTKPLDSARLDAVLEKVLPFARIADALARGSVGKVRTLAQLGVLAAVWIAYACADTFGWQLATLLPVFVLTVIPAALLWKIHSTLHATVGLPQRIIDCAARVADKASEFRQHYESRSQPSHVVTRPKFRQLWRAGKALLEIKALSDETREIVSLAGGALVLANPIFAIVLACATAAALVLTGIAAIVGVAYVL
jgi:hypothetical protein